MPNAQDLYQAHIDAGLNVLLSRSDWATNGGSWAVGGKPEGIIEHHTAPPPYSSPYPLNKLDGRSDGRIKCNINTKQDGSVYLMAYESCNYSAGSGAGKTGQSGTMRHWSNGSKNTAPPMDWSMNSNVGLRRCKGWLSRAGDD